jgi:molybdopterin converting factor small subunit
VRGTHSPTPGSFRDWQPPEAIRPKDVDLLSTCNSGFYRNGISGYFGLVGQGGYGKIRQGGEEIMTVKIKIAQVLRQYTDEKEIVEVDGSTVKQCLQNLINKYPETQKWIFDSNNAPRVIVLLNKSVVMPNQLDKAVADTDKIDLVPMIAGG